METFDFSLHVPETNYVDLSTKFQFGNGYMFASEPSGPERVKFTLYFTGFKYYFNADRTLDLTTNELINNMGALEAFYRRNGTNKSFFYNHEVLGQKVVKFEGPLEGVKPIKQANGVVEDFSIKLVEVGE